MRMIWPSRTCSHNQHGRIHLPLYDLSGAYGVNVFGYDFYKECIERGSERVRTLGPVLGAYHPLSPGTHSA
jgi:hypothetical protein